MRIFLSGPMSGYEFSNYPAFNAAAAKIRAAGYHVENPAENKECATWGAYMVLAVAQLVTCDMVVQLPGWENSRGARREYDLAKDFELDVISLERFELFFRAAKEGIAGINWTPEIKAMLAAQGSAQLTGNKMPGVDIDAAHKKQITEEELRAAGFAPINGLVAGSGEEIITTEVNGKVLGMVLKRTPSDFDPYKAAESRRLAAGSTRQFPANPYPQSEGDKS